MQLVDALLDDASTKRKRISPSSNHVSYQQKLTSGESTTSNSSLVDDDTINEDEDGETSSVDVLTIAPFEPPRQSINMNRRPRAQTMPENSSFGRMDLDEYRSPMGHLTWLASIADEEFLAAKLLAEMSTGATTELMNPWTYQSSDVWASDSNSSSSRIQGIQSDEPATRRRRRANSVIEMPTATLRPVRQV